MRQVIVPGLNDTKAYIEDLNGFLSNMKTVKKVELLGYHNMAENKYEKLGLDYRLKGWSQWIKNDCSSFTLCLQDKKQPAKVTCRFCY